MSERRCGRCKEVKLRSAFGKGRCADGLHSYCRPCNVAYWQEWYARKGDGFRLYVRNLRKADPNRIRGMASANRKKRRLAFPVEIHAQDRAKFRRRRSVSPEAFIAQAQRRRARKFAAPGSGVTAKQWRAVLDGSLGICAYCNTRAPLTMDHIEPLASGGDHDSLNIAAACDRCNKSKGAIPLLVWLARRAA